MVFVSRSVPVQTIDQPENSSSGPIPATVRQPRPEQSSPALTLPANTATDLFAPGIAPSTSLASSGMTGRIAHGFKTASSSMYRYAANAQAFTSSAAKNLWILSDTRTMLQPHANDPEFLRTLRGQDRELNTPFTFAQCREQLGGLRKLLDSEPGIEPRFKQALLKDIAAIEHAIHPLENGTSARGRAIKALMNMVNLWPAIVPSPLLANQAKTFAYTVAAATKAVVGVAGATLRPTSDGLPIPLGGGELGRHSDEVHFYPALLNMIFLSVEMSKKFGCPSVRQKAHAFDDNKLAHASIAAACGLALIAPFVWNGLKNKANQAVEMGLHAVALGMEKSGFAQQADSLRRQLTPGSVGEAVQAEFIHLWHGLEKGRLALQQARLDFTGADSSKELTRTLNSQCTHLLESIALCTKRLDKAFNLRATQRIAGENIPRSLSNPQDFASKLTLTLFAAGVTGSTVYLIQPDKIGTVDLSADAIVVTAVMLQAALNRQATRQDAMERFKGMAATSMVMAIALTADKLAKLATPNGLIEATASAPYYASVVMTAMAMTMPGPVARGAELGLNWAGSKIASIGGKISNLFKGPGDQQLATFIPSTQEEALHHVVTLGDYLRGLSPEGLQTYEAIAGESIHHAIEHADAQARDRRNLYCKNSSNT